MILAQKRIVGVIGPRKKEISTIFYLIAERVGKELGRKGIAVMCDAQDEIARFVCHACKREGGRTLGLFSKKDGYCDMNFLDYHILIPSELSKDEIIYLTALGNIILGESEDALEPGKEHLRCGTPLFCFGGIGDGNVSSKIFANSVKHFGYGLDNIDVAVKYFSEMLR